MPRPRKPIFEMDQKKLVAILKDPVRWGEFFLLNRDRSRRKYWSHQKDDLRCKASFIVHRDGRDTGKTVSLTTHLLHYAFTTRGGSVLVAAPHQAQLDTLVDEFEFQLENCSDLQASIAKNKIGAPKVVRKPYFKVEFANGTVVHFRPGGPYGEAFRSLHVQMLYIDEAAYIPDKAWKALRMCLLENGRMRVYSTPNGIRGSYYYKITKSDDWELFHWPSWITPRWSKERERYLLSFYGGKDTVDWQHEIAGEHGKPSFGAFNMEQYYRCMGDVKEYQRIFITGEQFKDCDSEDEIKERVNTLLNLSKHSGIYYLGGDLGYTADPTELILFALTSDTMRLVLRVHAEQVAYPIISELIAAIDRYYQPAAIGLDKGGNGLAVMQELLTLDKFTENQLTDRLEGFDFGGSTIIGQDEYAAPIKKRTKEYMTQLINFALAKKRVKFPADDHEIEDQFADHTYHIGEGGIIYSKGKDHIIDAIRCAFLAREMNRLNEYIDQEEEVYIPCMATEPIFR